MSDITIFKLSDLSSNNLTNIQVKSKKNNQISSLSNTIYGFLDSPVVALSNDVISWTAVNHATSYNIYIDNLFETNISTTSLDLSSLHLGDGVYRVEVQAIDDNNLYLNSRMSNTIVYVINVITYLSFTSTDSFSLTINNRNWDGTLEYSTDITNWSTWDGTQITSVNNALYLRGLGNTSLGIPGGLNLVVFIFTGSNISCSGNIENLLDYYIVAKGQHPTMGESCFSCLFNKCTNLITAPSLPATTLAQYCYSNMFYGCTALTTAPTLPATTLADNCYRGMFQGCSSLTTAPTLPATTLTNYCYYQMFYGCTNLATASELPATTLAESCYYSMFYNCTSLTTPAIMAGGTTQATPAKNCCAYMYYGCTALNIYTSSSGYTPFYKAITYSTTSSATNYRSSYLMFYNCYIDGSSSTANYLTAGTQYYMNSASNQNGYSGTVAGSCFSSSNPNSGNIYVKFGSAPTSANDYDAMLSATEGATIQGITTFTNQTVAYIWRDSGGSAYFQYNNVDYLVTPSYELNYVNYTYNNPYELQLTGNYDIRLFTFWYVGGGSDN